MKPDMTIVLNIATSPLNSAQAAPALVPHARTLRAAESQRRIKLSHNQRMKATASAPLLTASS
jgi:hypothetical protein